MFHLESLPYQEKEVYHHQLPLQGPGRKIDDSKAPRHVPSSWMRRHCICSFAPGQNPAFTLFLMPNSLVHSEFPRSRGQVLGSILELPATSEYSLELGTTIIEPES